MRISTYRLRFEQVMNAMVWIQDNQHRDIAVDQIADQACMSTYHFHRVFRSFTGETVYDHVKRLRMETAAHYLKLSPLPIASIAHKTGYQTHEAFTRAFRSHFKASPVAYRRDQGVDEWTDIKCFTDLPFHRTGFCPSRKVRMQAVVERLPLLRVAFIRKHGYYSNIAETFDRLARWASQKGILRPDSVYFGAAHDDPAVTPHNQMRYDACILVDKNVQPDGEVGIQMIGGREYATSTIRGCAETFEPWMTWLNCAWARQIGRLVAKAPALELYHTPPMDTAPDELWTDLFIPLEGEAKRILQLN